jgi:hypothetical protein
MIICDTNIWYRLTEEIVEKNSLRGKLICTHTTLVELNKSHVVYRDPQLVKKAIRSIQEFGKVGMPNPFEYGLGLLLPDFKPNGQNSKFLWTGMIKFLNSKIDINEESAILMKNFLKSNDIDFVKSIDFMNDMAAKIKANNIGVNPESRDYSISTKRSVAQYLIQYYQEQTKYSRSIGISINQDGWKNMQLFLDVWSDFYKDLDFHPNQKLHHNDWADILNMIYVGPDDQYWTQEKKWKRYISCNNNTTKYLYEPQS